MTLIKPEKLDIAVSDQSTLSSQRKVADAEVQLVSKRMRRLRIKKQREAYLFLLPNIAGFLLFTLFPLVFAIGLSFFKWSLLTPPIFNGLSNYVQLFTRDSVFRQVLSNTLYFVFVYVPLNLVIALGIAVWLASRIRWKGLFRTIMFLPVLTPGVAVAIVWMLMYNRSGIINVGLKSLFHIQGPDWLTSSVWAMPAIILMSLWYNFGYNMLIFSAGLQSIPQQLYEAAALDGSRRWSKFWHITLPMLSPSVFFALVMTLITSFQVFDQAFILTGGGPGASTTTLVLYTYQNGFSFFHMGYGATISTVLFLLIMAVTLGQFALQKKWVHYED